MMAEGQMRAESGYIRGAYSFGVVATMTPLAAIFMKFLNLSVFAPDNPEFVRDLLTIGAYGAVVIGVNVFMVKGLSRVITGDVTGNWLLQLGAFCIAGAMSGVILSISLFELDVVSMIQGAVGGIIAGLLIAFIVPRVLSADKVQ